MCRKTVLKGMTGQLVLAAMCRKEPEPGVRGCFGWEVRPIMGKVWLAVGILESDQLLTGLNTENHPWSPFLFARTRLVSLPTAKHVILETLWRDNQCSGWIDSNSLCPNREKTRMVDGPIPVEFPVLSNGESVRAVYPGTFLDLVVGDDLVKTFVEARFFPGFCDEGGDWRKILSQLGMPGYFEHLSHGI